MATQKKPKLDDNKNNDGKRPFSESDSETEQSRFTSSIHYPHFIVIESADPLNPITKLSPFIIEKQLLSILGTPKCVKKLRNNTILVECFTRQQSENLLKHKRFFQSDVKIYPHKTLNSCKGVVRCKELSVCSIAEIEDGLRSQGVTDVKRISVRRNGEMRTTNTYILTFSSPNLPQTVKIGYISTKVDLYIPNPMRCFKCQQYGHHISKCPNGPICAKCGSDEQNHGYDICTGTLKCINCKGTHAAFARECPVWKEEKEILNIKYSKNISFPEARQLVKQRHSNQENFSFSKSYASVTTPAKEDCRTCTILARLILRKFSEMKNELKDILPMQTFSAISQETFSSTTPTCSKPSSVKTSASSSVPSSKVSSSVVNQTTGQSSSRDKPYKEAQKAPSQPKKRITTKDVPSASTDNEEVFETRVSDSEVSQFVDSEKSEPGKKKNRKTRGRKITVKVGNPSVELSNKYEKLECITDEENPHDINKNEEEMEESDGSECDSTWACHRSDWNKDLESWQVSTAETKVIKQT